MKRAFSVLIFSALFFISANSASALTVDEQIALLQSQIAELQAQLNSLIQSQAQTGTYTPENTTHSYAYCVDLQYNMRRGARDIYTNREVTKLQNFLRIRQEANWPSNQIATGYFGYVTERAVANFQLHHGLVTSTFSSAAGSVGPITRAKIKEITCNYNVEPIQTETGNGDLDGTENFTISVSTDKSIYGTDEDILITTVVTNNSNNSLPITFNTGCETEVSIKNINTGVIHKSNYEYCTQSIRTTSVSGNSSRAWQDKFQNYYEGLPSGTYVAVIGVGNLGERQTNSFTIQNLDDSGNSDVDINAYLGVSFNLANNQTAGLIGTDYRIKYVQSDIFCVTTPCDQPDPQLVVTNSTLNFYQTVSIASGSSKQIPGTPYYAKILSKIGTPGSGHIINMILNDSPFDDTSQDGSTNPSIQVNSPNGGEVYQQGGIMNITWSAVGMPSEGVLGLSFVNQVTGVNHYPLPHCGSTGANCVDISTGSYQLTIPNTVDAGTYKLRLYCALPNSESYCKGTSIGYEDYSNGSFVVYGSSEYPQTSVVLSATPTSGVAPLTVTLNVVATDIPSCTGSSWNYGDGNIEAVTPGCIPGPTTYNSFTDSRTHTYNQPGTYVISASYGPASDSIIVNVSGESFALGDVNMDGQVDILDTVAIRYYVLGYDGYTNLSDLQMELADVDDNGVVNNNDYLLLVEVTKWFVEDQLPARFGDMNGDLVINLSDSVIANRIVEGVQTATDLQKSLLDVDLDGDRDLQDVQYIVSAGVGNITLPVTVTAPSAVRGDVDGNGVVELRDPAIAEAYLDSGFTLSADEISRADLDGDGVVSRRDVANLFKIYWGLPEVVFVRGDTNLDGEVTLVDVLLAARYVSGTETLTSDQVLAADLDDNGVVTDWDVVNINRILIGLPEVDFLLGDVNLDGSIDVADALLALRHVEGIRILNTAGRLSADIDSNAVVDLRDVENIVRLAVGLETQNFMIGDINHDGLINLTDVVKINRYVAGLEQLNALQVFLADVNLDGVVNSVDVQQASNLAVGLPVVY